MSQPRELPTTAAPQQAINNKGLLEQDAVVAEDADVVVAAPKVKRKQLQHSNSRPKRNLLLSRVSSPKTLKTASKVNPRGMHLAQDQAIAVVVCADQGAITGSGQIPHQRQNQARIRLLQQALYPAKQPAIQNLAHSR